MGFISEIIDINKNINIEYRTSTKPKFIRDFIVKIRRNKLKKSIRTIKDHVYLPAELFAEYIKEINSNYDRHQHCINISPVESNTNLLIATFKIKVEEHELYVSIGPEIEDNSSYIVRYLYSKGGNTLFSFTEENITCFEDEKRYETEEYPYKSHVVNDVLKDLFAKIIIEDIYKYLIDVVKRSERIGEK